MHHREIIHNHSSRERASYPSVTSLLISTTDIPLESRHAYPYNAPMQASPCASQTILWAIAIQQLLCYTENNTQSHGSRGYTLIIVYWIISCWTPDPSQQLSFFIPKNLTRPKYIPYKLKRGALPRNLKEGISLFQNNAIAVLLYQHYRPSSNSPSSDMARVPTAKLREGLLFHQENNCRLIKFQSANCDSQV